MGRSTVQRWVDRGVIRADRTVGGHRRIPLAEAIRFVRSSDLTIRDLGVLGLTEAEAPPTGDAALALDALTGLLMEGQEDVFTQRLVRLYLQGRSTAELFDGLIAPAMWRIGDLWPDNPRAVLIEHRATAICVAAIHQLRRLLPTPDPDAPCAVGSAVPGDPFILPSLMARTTLTELGWRATDLGPDTPCDTLALAAEEREARLVWLSVSRRDPDEDFAHNVHALAGRVERLGAKLVIGGQTVPESWSPRDGCVSALKTMGELAAFARGCHNHPKAPT